VVIATVDAYHLRDCPEFADQVFVAGLHLRSGYLAIQPASIAIFRSGLRGLPSRENACR
jgi:hypothetical protein